jgi:hypothetical protein
MGDASFYINGVKYICKSDGSAVIDGMNESVCKDFIFREFVEEGGISTVERDIF